MATTMATTKTTMTTKTKMATHFRLQHSSFLVGVTPGSAAGSVFLEVTKRILSELHLHKISVVYNFPRSSY